MPAEPEETREKPLRAAVIGLGEGAGKIILPGLAGRAGVELAAGCDPDGQSRRRAAARWQIPAVFPDAEAMLAAIPVDIVVVASPPQTHFAMGRLVLSHGCHLYCEKPFMTSLAEADEIIELAAAAGRLVGVNSQYYQMPIYRSLQEKLAEPATGRLFHIEAWQQMNLLPPDEGGWKAALLPRRVLLEFGTHAVDLICRFFAAFPLAVTAQTARVRADIEGDVCLNVRLDFPDGRLATLMFNRRSHAPMRYFEMRLNCEEAALRASLGGVARLDLGWNSARRRPRARFSLATGGEARLERGGESRLLARQPDAAYGAASGAHFARFAAAVRRGEVTEVDLSVGHAREILRIILAAYESVDQGGQLVCL